MPAYAALEGLAGAHTAEIVAKFESLASTAGDDASHPSGDAARAHLYDPPPEWGNFAAYNVATRVAKLLVLLYSRVGQAFSSEAKVRSKIVSPGTRVSLRFLGLVEEAPQADSDSGSDSDADKDGAASMAASAAEASAVSNL